VAHRVTADEVKELIDVDDSVTNLYPFIEAANRTINNICTSTNLTAADKKEIERWLSAHFTAIRDPLRANEKAGPVSESFQYKLGLGLRVTTYGQQAILLDHSGALGRWADGKKTLASMYTLNP